MTKLISKIATGIAILGLASPALAASSAAQVPAKNAQVTHHRKHSKVAQAETKKDVKDTKKVEKKGATKSEGKGATKSEGKSTTKSEGAAATPSATPAPAPTPAPAAK